MSSKRLLLSLSLSLSLSLLACRQIAGRKDFSGATGKPPLLLSSGLTASAPPERSRLDLIEILPTEQQREAISLSIQKNGLFIVRPAVKEFGLGRFRASTESDSSQPKPYQQRGPKTSENIPGRSLGSDSGRAFDDSDSVTHSRVSSERGSVSQQKIKIIRSGSPEVEVDYVIVETVPANMTAFSRKYFSFDGGGEPPPVSGFSLEKIKVAVEEDSSSRNLSPTTIYRYVPTTEVDLLSKSDSFGNQDVRRYLAEFGISAQGADGVKARLATGKRAADTQVYRAVSSLMADIKKNDLSKFEIGNILGKGSFGEVFAYTYKVQLDGQEVYIDLAMKKLDIISVQQKLDFDSEIDLLTRLSNEDRTPFILGHSVSADGRDGSIFMLRYEELPVKKDLDDLIKTEFLPLIHQAASLHKLGYVYRDFKLDNYMLRPDGTAVLLDLGLAKQISELERNSEKGGTPYTMDFEVLSKINPDYRAADQFSLAMTMLWRWIDAKYGKKSFQKFHSDLNVKTIEDLVKSRQKFVDFLLSKQDLTPREKLFLEFVKSAVGPPETRPRLQDFPQKMNPPSDPAEGVQSPLTPYVDESGWVF